MTFVYWINAVLHLAMSGGAAPCLSHRRLDQTLAGGD
jgi:hypothetical protein